MLNDNQKSNENSNNLINTAADQKSKTVVVNDLPKTNLGINKSDSMSNCDFQSKINTVTNKVIIYIQHNYIIRK